jgi:hypothetical protein
MYAAFLVVGWLASRKVRDGTAADLIVAAGDAAVDGRAHDDGDVGRRRLSARHDEGAYKSSIQLGIQGGLCFGISLILGGVLFAGIMRRHGFTTLIDPFEARFGRQWAAVSCCPRWRRDCSGAPSCSWRSDRRSACCSA